MISCSMGRPTVDIDSQRVGTYYLNGPRRVLMDTNRTDETGKLAIWRQQVLQLGFEVFHRVSVKNQTTDSLSRLLSTRVHASPLKDDVLVLTMTEVQLEVEKNETEAQVWPTHSPVTMECTP